MTEQRRCPACGRFLRRRSTRGPAPTYCDVRCRKRAHAERHPGRVARLAREAAYRRRHGDSLQFWRICADCGCPYLPRRESEHCPAPECLRARRSFEAIWQDGATRARKHGGQVERFDVRRVHERDGWVCHLCRQPTSGKVGRDPHSATLDHLTPLEQGGDHTPANVATAHLHCNAVRGSRGIEQARERLRDYKPAVTPARVHSLPEYARRVAGAVALPSAYPGGPPVKRRVDLREEVKADAAM